VFRSSPRTGKSFIVLVDIVYYLIFTSCILFNLKFEPDLGWTATVNPRQIQAAIIRIAGILLIIGGLHGINLLLMPVLGQLSSLNRHLDQRVHPEH